MWRSARLDTLPMAVLELWVDGRDHDQHPVDEAKQLEAHSPLVQATQRVLLPQHGMRTVGSGHAALPVLLFRN